jgi:hypothetical protein
MDPLSELTLDTFRKHAGETFRDTEAGTVLTLLDVEDLTPVARHVPEGQRAPFSLIFGGPAEPVLPQGIRPLVHDALGELALFLVPVALEADGMRYQAVFS